MHTRRRFIEILPLTGLAALAACGEKAAPQAAAPAPVQTPAATAPPPVAAVAPAPAPTPSAAAAGPMVDPTDANAVALGYVADSKTTKDAKHTAGAACANCALFGGKAGDPSGPCPLYAGKQVTAAGWCTAYAKKG